LQERLFSQERRGKSFERLIKVLLRQRKVCFGMRNIW